jgi:hypothetical protein
MKMVYIQRGQSDGAPRNANADACSLYYIVQHEATGLIDSGRLVRGLIYLKKR